MKANLLEQIKERYQLYRVNQDGHNIAGIKDPSEKVQMAAIKKDLGNITLIDSPCEAVQVYVAERDPFSVSVYQSSEKAQMVAIEHDPTVIVHIDNPSSDLCKAAIEKAFPGAEISYANPEATQKLFRTLNRITFPDERKQLFESFMNELTIKMATSIEAIQVLQGNAPAEIFEERFKDIRDKYHYEEQQLNESINDIESGIKYSDPRMLSDDHFKKIEIQGSAQYFANQIKKDLTPEELLTFSKELESPLNLPLGQAPTIEEALSLFQNEYDARLGSAVYENEKAGRYEVGRPTIEYQYKSEELLRAGTQPYSPNYKEVFEKAGLANEFKTFEKACCERVQWNHSYNYAIATRDIAELNDLERKLPTIDAKVESSREQVYNKLLNTKLEREVKQLGEALKYGGNGLLDVRGQLSNNASQFLEKYDMKEDAERYTRLISIDPNISDITQEGEKFIEEFDMKVKTASYQELNNIGRVDIIQKIKEEEYVGADVRTIEKDLLSKQPNDKRETLSSRNSISSIHGRSKTEAELPPTRREMLNMGNEQLQLSEVRKNGTVIQLIQNPSEKVQLAAVQESEFSLKYIQSPSEKVQLAAVQKYGPAIQHIQNPSEKVQLAAVQERVFSLKYIQNPSEKVQLAAIQKSKSAIQYIKDPTEKVQLVAKKKGSEATQTVFSYSSKISDINIFSLKDGGYAIRCQIDGVQQSATKMSKEDANTLSEKTDRTELAYKYFQNEINNNRVINKGVKL